MDKPATTDHEVHALIRDRWSPRAFSDKVVATAELRSLLEAARWAASAFNEQPWRFIVARREDTQEFARLLSCLAEPNQVWAKDAGVLMLSVAAATFTRNDKPNRHAYHDVGLATSQLVLQATALGLGVHMMAGFSSDKATELYGIPESFEPVAAIALGYPGDPDDLPEPLAERERAARDRKAQADFVFGGSWAQSLKD